MLTYCKTVLPFGTVKIGQQICRYILKQPHLLGLLYKSAFIPTTVKQPHLLGLVQGLHIY